MTGLNLEAASATKTSPRRKLARPPVVLRLPRFRPLSLLKGATPTRAAICFRLSFPNSGRSATIVLAVTGPTPGTLSIFSARSRFSASWWMVVWISSSSLWIRSSKKVMCSSRSTRMLSGQVERRFFSVVAITTSCRRRSTQADRYASASVWGGLAPGCVTDPKWAITPASILSVLARMPCDLANWRTRIGLTIATAIPTAQSAWATGRSYPPVASITTLGDPFPCNHFTSLPRPSPSLLKCKTALWAYRLASNPLFPTSIPTTISLGMAQSFLYNHREPTLADTDSRVQATVRARWVKTRRCLLRYGLLRPNDNRSAVSFPFYPSPFHHTGDKACE